MHHRVLCPAVVKRCSRRSCASDRLPRVVRSRPCQMMLQTLRPVRGVPKRTASLGVVGQSCLLPRG